MNQIKILHTADLHLGGKLTGLGPAGEKRAIEKFQLFLQMLRWLDQNNIEIFLIAGDFFEGHCPSKIWQSVQEEFRKRPNLWVFIAPGNHDYNSIDSPYREEGWPENVKIFQGPMERIDLVSKKVSVFGCGFTASFEKRAFDQAADWAALVEGPGKGDPDWINLGLFHGEITSKEGASPYNPIHPPAWPKDLFTYVGLGHIHKPTPLSYEGKTAYAYSGAPFGSGFDETGNRGFYAGKITPYKAALDFIQLEPARFYRFDVNLTGASSSLDIQICIQEALEEKEEMRKNYYRLYLRGALNPEIKIDPQWLASLFEGKTAYLEIIDQTHPALDLKEESEKSTLLGFFVRGILAREKKLEDFSSSSPSKGRDKRILDQALTLGLKAFYEEGGFS